MDMIDWKEFHFFFFFEVATDINICHLFSISLAVAICVVLQGAEKLYFLSG